MKTYSLDQVQDEIIGKIGTPERDRFEYELQMDIIGKTNKRTRQANQILGDQAVTGPSSS